MLVVSLLLFISLINGYVFLQHYDFCVNKLTTTNTINEITMGNTTIGIPSTIPISASLKSLSFIGADNEGVFFYHFFK